MILLVRFWYISVSLICKLHVRRSLCPILRHVLAHRNCVIIMCNLYIKETEISEKRTKGIKTWKITYSVILSVLSNKTNLILVFSSPLTNLTIISFYIHSYIQKIASYRGIHWKIPIKIHQEKKKKSSNFVVVIRNCLDVGARKSSWEILTFPGITLFSLVRLSGRT